MRVLVLIACVALAGIAAQATTWTDNFDGSSLDGRWTPHTTGTYGVSSGQLTAQVSDTLWANPMAVNLFTTGAPEGDFTATMKCSLAATAGFIPNVGIGMFSTDYQSMVMIAEEADKANWGEFGGINKFGTDIGVGTISGSGMPFGLTHILTGKAISNVPFYVQISRSGANYTLACSLNGTNFTTDWSGTYSGQDLTQLGLCFFGGAPTTTQNGSVDWVAVTPEPASLSLLALGAFGLLRHKRA